MINTLKRHKNKAPQDLLVLEQRKLVKSFMGELEFNRLSDLIILGDEIKRSNRDIHESSRKFHSIKMTLNQTLRQQLDED